VIEQEKVLYLGMSDVSAWNVGLAAASVGKALFCIYQSRWNAMLRDVESEILPWQCKVQDEGTGFLGE
jgi:aryl-alcohol dehydrogenase-like predicted oxidoreductase